MPLDPLFTSGAKIPTPKWMSKFVKWKKIRRAQAMRQSSGVINSVDLASGRGYGTVHAHNAPTTFRAKKSK